MPVFHTHFRKFPIKNRNFFLTNFVFFTKNSRIKKFFWGNVIQKTYTKNRQIYKKKIQAQGVYHFFFKFVNEFSKNGFLAIYSINFIFAKFISILLF